MEYALIKNGKVENVIVADPDFITLIAPEWDHIERIDTPEEIALGVGIGWGWNAQDGFIRPPAPDTVPEPRHIAVGSFFDRFGAEKYNILASTDPVVQALIKDVSVRKFIDLDRPDLLQGLQLVQSKGFAIDPQAIVSAPVQPEEKP